MGTTRKLKFCGAIGLVVLTALIVHAQGSAASPPRKVEWKGIGGLDGEFSVYFPSGYLSNGFGRSLIGSKGGPLVEKGGYIARYINGVLLTLTFYDGDVSKVETREIEHRNLRLLNQREVNGVVVKEFDRAESGAIAAKKVLRTQSFTVKDHLYILQSFAPTRDDKIANAFFASVRLTNKKVTVAPNAPPGATKTSLPGLFEDESGREPDDKIFDLKDVDRAVIVVDTTGPDMEINPMRGRQQYYMQVAVTYAASGKVTKVEFLSGPAAFRSAVEEAIKKTTFIPAEKDGKLVSVREEFQYSSVRPN